eukprot:CAMPEP_0206422418 /NCGR_PEP_ID=MMETSP0324_2-20121206/2074_1 /ASSEMBLY_ACC=CAM_ASM_000836 /TAXON_ID=2866 /ORGANISM="Crypthecodinium cohnii, Strain Seligo" /LENGTH=101 /DNA_ID=CAMNT_0053886785 /DNA_START=90 /DNA_END=395 /DNA_ORIENTATION=-
MANGSSVTAGDDSLTYVQGGKEKKLKFGDMVVETNAGSHEVWIRHRSHSAIEASCLSFADGKDYEKFVAHFKAKGVNVSARAPSVNTENASECGDLGEGDD